MLKSIDPERLEAIIQEAIAHSLSVHGDRNPHPECAQCRRLAKNAMEAYGLTPNEIHKVMDTVGVPKDYREGAELFLQMFPKEKSAWD